MNKKDLLYSYTSGWRDGAATRAIDPKKGDHENKDISTEYYRGFTDGREARNRASENAQKRLGVKFDILRGTG